jgi:Tol biopolymer transport system component
MRSLRAASLLLVLAATPLTAQQSAGRAFTPQDWYRLTTVGSPAMSPDGRSVAFTVTTVKESENERHSEVWVVPTAGGEAVRYTSPGVSSSSPRWSHDGTHLFFTSRRPGGDGSAWALRMDRPSGEAFQMEYPDGSRPRGGAFVVFAQGMEEDEDDDEDDAESEKDPFERMHATARPPFGAVTKPVNPARFDGRHIVDNGYKRNGPGFVANRREARTYDPAQIWIQRDGDTTKTQLTHTVYSHRDVMVSPDGRHIAFVADAGLRSDSVVQAERDSIALLPFSTERDEAIRNDSDIFIIPVAGGEPRRLTNAPGDERSVAWSPDSRQVSYVSSPRRTASSRLYVVDANGGEPRNVLGDWQYEPGGYDWTPDGEILASAAIGGRTALFRVSPRNGRMTELIGGRRRLSGFTYDERADKVAYVSTSVDRPTELYIADADGRNERQLTTFNDALNREIAWPDAERFTYESVGGVEIEAWMQKPYG